MTKKITMAICGGMIAVLPSFSNAQEQPNRPKTIPGASTAIDAAGNAKAHAERAFHGAQATGAIKSSQIVGSSVQGNDGKGVGQIRDLVIDPQTGRVEFALISVSATSSTPSTTSTPGATTSVQLPGATAMGKTVPIPWQLLRAGTQSSAGAHSTAGTVTTPGIAGQRPTAGMMGQTTFVFQGDTSKLQNAPTLDANDLNQLRQDTFGQRIYTHWGLDWNRRSVGAPGSDIRTGAGAGTSPGTGIDRSRPDSSTAPDLNRPNTPPRSDSTRPDATRPDANRPLDRTDPNQSNPPLNPPGGGAEKPKK